LRRCGVSPFHARLRDPHRFDAALSRLLSARVFDACSRAARIVVNAARRARGVRAVLQAGSIRAG
jgi:hypothetical protein